MALEIEKYKQDLTTLLKQLQNDIKNNQISEDSLHKIKNVNIIFIEGVMGYLKEWNDDRYKAEIEDYQALKIEFEKLKV